MKNYSAKAFTLAEVLITLAILGVVAATVIPAILNSDTAHKESKTKLLKEESVFMQAWYNLKAQGVDLDTLYSGNAMHDTVANAFIPVLAIQMNCHTGSGCWPNLMYKDYDGVTSYLNIDTNAGRSKMLLNDGTPIAFWDAANGGCSLATTDGVNDACGSIQIDINGPKAPNQRGIDLLDLYITKRGVNVGSTYEQNIIIDY